jgi:RNA polymerase sigma-70 factor (ECF subfamily)
VTEDEYRAFYAAAFPRLVGQVYLMTGDLGEAQDAVQEAFVRAWGRRRRFADGDQPDAWIRTVARRLAVSRWRSARSARAAWRRYAAATAHVAPPGVDKPLIVSALQRLPEEQRRAIVLHHLCDLPVEQVATETGAPVGTVKARLARGRATLRILLMTDETTDEMQERRHA